MLAQSATTTAPWWGVPALAGAFTVLGVGLSQGSTFLNNWLRNRREDTKERLAEQAATYARILGSATSLLAQVASDQQKGRISADSVMQAQSVGGATFVDFLAMQLVMDNRVAPAMKGLIDAITELSKFYEAVDDGALAGDSASTHERHMKAIESAITALVSSIRKTHGLRPLY